MSSRYTTGQIFIEVPTPNEGIPFLYEGETFTASIDLNGTQRKITGDDFTGPSGLVDYQEGDVIRLFVYTQNGTADNFVTPVSGLDDILFNLTDVPYYELTLDSNLQASISIETADDGIGERGYFELFIDNVHYQEDNRDREGAMASLNIYDNIIQEVEVPVEVIKEVPVEVIKEVEVIRTVFKDREVEVIKEVEVPVEVIKEVEVPVEVIKEVEVPVEVIKEVEVPVEVIKTIEIPVGDDLIVGSGKMKGTKRNDFFRSFQDDDILIGKGGNDYLRAGAGSDILKGGKGDDILKGGNGNDTYFDGRGDDLMVLGRGDDMVYLGSGDNFITDFNETDDTLIARGGISWDGNVGTYDNGTVTLL